LDCSNLCIWNFQLAKTADGITPLVSVPSEYTKILQQNWELELTPISAHEKKFTVENKLMKVLAQSKSTKSRYTT
jgi:hypothetical protein